MATSAIVESGSALDGLGATMTATAQASESASLADTQVDVLGIFTADLESGSAVDLVLSALTYYGQLVDTGSSTDALSSTVGTSPASVAEAVFSIDQSSVTQLYGVSSAIEIGLAQDANLVLSGTTNVIAETGASADSSSGLAAANFPRVAAETGSLAESLAPQLASAVTLAEVGASVEVVSGSLALIGSLTEAGAALDAPSAARFTLAAGTEAGSLAEVVGGLKGGNPAIFESGVGLDTSVALAALLASLTDVASAAEIETALWSTSATSSEAGLASDLSALARSAVVSISETASLLDVIASLLTSIAQQLDAGLAQESVQAAAAYFGALGESLAGTDVESSVLVAHFSTLVAEATSAAELLNAVTGLICVNAEAGSAIDAQLQTSLSGFALFNPTAWVMLFRRRDWKLIRKGAGMQNIVDKRTSESMTVDVDCSDLLGPQELILSAGPPIDADGFGLGFGPVTVNQGQIAYPISGRIVQAGKAIQFNLSGGEIPAGADDQVCTIRILLRTNINPTVEATVALRLIDTPQ